MGINDLLRRLCDELTEGDVPAPLEQPLRLGLVWADLCRLAGEPAPPDVVACLDAPAVDRVWADPARRPTIAGGIPLLTAAEVARLPGWAWDEDREAWYRVPAPGA